MSDTACDWSWATYLELSVIHSSGSFCLGLFVCRKKQAVHQGQLLPSLCLGDSQSPKAPRHSPLPVGFLLSLNTEITSSCTSQQLHLCSTGGAIASPQADATWRAVLGPRKMSSAVWGMTQHREHFGYPFSFLPRATNLQLSFHGSIPLCPSSAIAQGKWLQMLFCVLAL